MSTVKVANVVPEFRSITITLETFEEAKAIWMALEVNNRTIIESHMRDNLTLKDMEPKSIIWNQLNDVFNPYKNKQSSKESSDNLRVRKNDEIIEAGDVYHYLSNISNNYPMPSIFIGNIVKKINQYPHFASPIVILTKNPPKETLETFRVRKDNEKVEEGDYYRILSKSKEIRIVPQDFIGMSIFSINRCFKNTVEILTPIK